MALFAWTNRLLGEAVDLEPWLLLAYPELRGAHYRRGGVPPRVGGWCLGLRSVAAIVLGRTVWLAHDAHLTPELLLHEYAHVEQWRTVPWFALRYVWESFVRGYSHNKFEVAACQAARLRLQSLEDTR